MVKHAGFLKDILERPTDDVPRLVYADWLDENGGSVFADFIRVQVALAKHGPRRPVYTHIDTFYFRRGRGSCSVEGHATRVGDRVDLFIPSEQRRRFYKQKWHGVLVTGITHMEWLNGPLLRTYIEFTVDEGSRPWTGEAIRERELALWLTAFDASEWSFLGPSWEAVLDPRPRRLCDVTLLVSRGFVSTVWCTVDIWRRHGDRIKEMAPVELYEEV